ncbi:MAG: hypothetical protein CR986_00295 [Ignavibacteriae bacterium]|nr:MAG: hypothetical protein CR986_00295 [Ignavibacteriota bacterium]
MISKDLLEVLCCPLTKSDLILDGDYLISSDKESRMRYKIKNGIPILLIDEAEKLSLNEWQKIMEKQK